MSWSLLVPFREIIKFQTNWNMESRRLIIFNSLDLLHDLSKERYQTVFDVAHNKRNVLWASCFAYCVSLRQANS